MRGPWDNISVKKNDWETFRDDDTRSTDLKQAESVVAAQTMRFDSKQRSKEPNFPDVTAATQIEGANVSY